ncbi:MAG: low specificity L-threonine aldolase [Thermoplasmatales archaeon]|nr:low specificity L-threonine aldolase [Thermoplasmatales archaeon]
MSNNKGFASDNHSGVHPDILKAIVSANVDYTIAYGDDEYTERAVKKFKEHFGDNIDVYFVYNGTAANILGLKTVTHSFNSIICAETAHLNVHECCGPEKFTGCKLITILASNGKLTVDQIEPYVVGFGDPHVAQPKVISITQPTELGTVYTLKEIKELSDFAHKNGMLIHMDGARLYNAAASLNVGMKEITGDAGVDILSFGGTKNGMMFGEAVIFFNKKVSKDFVYIRKQGMQLASKMRFISAQFEAFLSNDLWLKNARYANKMTQLLHKELKDVPQIKITQKVEANAIFAIIPKKYIIPLQKEYFFHVFNERTSEVRWMCSFDTTKEDIMNFTEIIRKTIAEK